jgi:hypothetical protein
MSSTPAKLRTTIMVNVLLHVHPFVGNMLVNKFPRRPILVNSPLLGYAAIDEAVFSMSPAPSNSRNGVLCDQLLGYVTVLTQLYFLCGLCHGYITIFPFHQDHINVYICGVTSFEKNTW